MGRAAEMKAAALEELIEEAENPTIIGVQECAHGDFVAQSPLVSVLNEHNYAAFQCHRADDRKNKHGGAALLVRVGVVAKEYVWDAAAKWEGCECVSVIITLPDNRGEFIVSNMYVHGGGIDTDGFDRVIRTLRDDQILLGDLNAQLPGSKRGDNTVLAEHFRKRGESLLAVIDELGATYPTPTGPTRPVVHKDPTTGRKTIDYDCGTINDHIIVGSEALRCVGGGDTESLVLTGYAWPSDHIPLVWSAMVGLGQDIADMNWARRPDWTRVTAQHKIDYNKTFRNCLRGATASRRMNALLIDDACLTAARATLPHTRPNGVRHGLFWSNAARRRVDEVTVACGDGARAELTRAFGEARHQTLAAEARLQPNPSSGWRFIKKYYGFGGGKQLRAPLLIPADGDVTRPPDPEEATTKVTAMEERVDVFATAYAAVSANPAGVDAQQQLRDAMAKIPPPQATRNDWRPISVNELKVAVSQLSPNKCSDFLGIRSEHLRALDDESLGLVLPIIDRVLRIGIVPLHWRSASVTPVPKRNRDLSLVKSWRPVSVTAILCRMCEVIQLNRASHAFEEARLGKAQFGFRRGVATSLPLTGVCMSALDGRHQFTRFTPWDANDAAVADKLVYGTQETASSAGSGRRHTTLIVSIDGSEAFCRAMPAKAIDKLLSMGLVAEARWIANFLSGRSLVVREKGCSSEPKSLARGVPQGSVLGPLLWSFVIDDLVARCEEICKTPVAGCIAVPIVFADDINFVIRGFNPTSMVKQANVLMSAVREWATAEGVPMAKLGALWQTGGAHAAEWASSWATDHPLDGEIVFDDKVRCFPGVQPLKLLGVTFDATGNYSAHVDALVETCERHLRLLTGMKGTLKAEQLAVLYRGVILSRLLYAVDVWYPFITAADAARLETIHYRACVSVTGVPATLSVGGTSTVYEGGFRTFKEEALAEIVKTADKLRRMSDGCNSLRESCQVFGVEWVVRLFRDGAMPSAALRDVVCADGSKRDRAQAVYPPADFSREHTSDSPNGLALRDVGYCMRHGGPFERKLVDGRVFHPSLRELPRVHAWAPHELRLFDTHIEFIVDPPGGLNKSVKLVTEMTAAEKEVFARANANRIADLVEKYGYNSIFVFTDGAREEQQGRDNPERCAGAYVVCVGPDPNVRGSVKHKAQVAPSPIACIYTAELSSIHDALVWVRDNEKALFVDGRPRHVVLVTDSKSSLESVRTTWVRRIQRTEQDVCRLLFDLASLDIKVALAFVFSHVGGCDGNEYIDAVAQRACKKVGRSWETATLWHVDTTRRVLRNHNREVDDKLCGRGVFRFDHMPGALHGAPSKPLPREMTRSQERLLYAARIGIFASAGGLINGVIEECPLCGVPALGRAGATVLHLADCVRLYTAPPIELELEKLWTDPFEAVQKLSEIKECIRLTPRGHARAAAFEQRFLRRLGGRR